MEFLIKDNLVFIMHSGAPSLCVYKSIKKTNNASCFQITSIIKIDIEKSIKYYI